MGIFKREVWIMASGDDLLKLFKAFKENDKVGFTKVAYDIIEEEKRKNIK